MRHSVPNIECRIDPGGDGALDVPFGIIEQHLVVADMYADRRKVREVCLQWGHGVEFRRDPAEETTVSDAAHPKRTRPLCRYPSGRST